MAVSLVNTGIAWGAGKSWYGTTADTGGDTTANFGTYLYKQDVSGICTSYQRNDSATVSCNVHLRCGLWSETSTQAVFRLQGRFDYGGYSNYIPFAIGIIGKNSSSANVADCSGYVTGVWDITGQSWKYSTPLYQVTIDKTSAPVAIHPYMMIGYMPMYNSYGDGGTNSGGTNSNFSAGNDWVWWGNTERGALVINGVAYAASVTNQTMTYNKYTRNAMIAGMGSPYYSFTYANAPIRLISGSTHKGNVATVFKSDGKKSNATNKIFVYGSDGKPHQAVSVTVYDSDGKAHSMSTL